MAEVGDNLLAKLIEGHFASLERYARMNPFIALCILRSYFDVVGDLIKPGLDFNGRRALIAEHFTNNAQKISELQTAGVFTQFAAPTAEMVQAVTGGMRDVAESIAVLRRPV